jgi:hypothetical protein
MERLNKSWVFWRETDLGRAARDALSWEWLATQSGGASATLRRLVEDAKKGSAGKELLKNAQERAHKYMSALAGDYPRSLEKSLS